MAAWTGLYFSDLGQDFPLALHRCYVVADGARTASREATDRLYLPPLWLSHCQPRERAACEFVGTQRLARAYFAPGAYLAIPWPWRGGQALYLQALQELAANPAIFALEMRGETLNSFWAEQLANQ